MHSLIALRGLTVTEVQRPITPRPMGLNVLFLHYFYVILIIEELIWRPRISKLHMAAGIKLTPPPNCYTIYLYLYIYGARW